MRPAPPPNSEEFRRLRSLHSRSASSQLLGAYGRDFRPGRKYIVLPPHYNSQKPPSRGTSGAVISRLWAPLRLLAGLRRTRFSPPPLAFPLPAFLDQCGGASIHTFPSCKSVLLGDAGFRERGHFAREYRAPGFPTYFTPRPHILSLSP